MNNIVVNNEYNLYPDIVVYNKNNPTLHSPYAECDISFYCTKETFMDVDLFRRFLKNAELSFRASKEYKAYKSYIFDMLGDHCQVMGNISSEDASIELHHNIIGLFDICLLISCHMVNTVGIISTFDLIQFLILEHWENRVPLVKLSKTAHQLFTADPNAYIPPNQVFGKWWELLSRYRYGITLSIANKVLSYIKKASNEMPNSIQIMQQEEILSYAWANEYGEPFNKYGYLPYSEDIKEYSI